MSPVLEPGTLDFISHSEEQTRRLGAKLGKLLEAGQVIAVLGDLGCGKTRLAQGVGRGLDVPEDEVINSPTFTFVNEYEGRLSYYHIDLYRLTQTAEAETLGLDDYLYGDGVCLIEWANRLSTLPTERLEVELRYMDHSPVGDTKRRVIIRAFGAEHTNLLNAFKHLAFGVKTIN